MDRPTLENWMRPPGNRWAFRHVRELIPTARIPARAPRELPERLAPELLELSFEDSSGQSSTMERYFEESYADAFVVLHGGELVLEWYRDGVEPDDRHIVFSVTKSITGLLAGALAGHGKLDLDAPTVDYVPEVRDSGYGDTTVRHLLDMLANVGFDEDYSMGADVMRRYRRSASWEPGPVEGGLHDFICSLPVAGEHGKSFRYLSPGMDLLGWVCERAAGEPLADAFSDFLWTPMGAEADGELTVDRKGAGRTAGGLIMTARDTARIGQLLLDGGGDALPAEFVDDLFRGGDPEAWATGDFADYFPGGTYRSGWYDLRVEPETIGAFGIHMQVLYVDRPRQVVVVKQSSWPDPESEAADHATLAAARALADAVAGPTSVSA